MDMVEVEARVIAKTDMALLVEVDGEEVWIPLSQIDEDASDLGEGSKRGDRGLLVIPEWLAEEKLIDVG